jgi:hypothetical protein
MECSTCGMENQSATRFCIHCGAAQTPPAEAGGGSTVIAAMAQAGGAAKAGMAAGAAPPPWATPGAAAGGGENAGATGLGTPAPRDTSPGGTSLSRFGQDAGGTVGVRANVPAAQPPVPAGVVLEPGSEPALFAPSGTLAPAPAADPLPSFSDATSYMTPAAGEAPGRPYTTPASDEAPDRPFIMPASDEAPDRPYITPGAGEAPHRPAAAPGRAWTADALDESPTAPQERTAVLPRSSRPPPMEAGQPTGDGGELGALPPAYDAAPRHRSGMLIVVGLAVAALVAIGGFFVYQVSQDRARAGGPGTATADATTSAPSTPSAPQADAARETAPPAGSTSASSQSVDTSPAAPVAPVAPPPGSSPESAKAAPSPTPTGTPAIEPPEKRPAPRPPAAKAVRPAAPVAPTPSPPVDEAVVAPAPPPVRAAPAPAPQRATDHWTQMSDELAGCKREDFIKRVVCDQRVRLRYCDGYWGKAPQCPAAVQADHGQ